MKDIADKRRARKAAADNMQTAAAALDALAADGVAADAAEMVEAVAAFDAAKAEFETAKAAVERAEAVEAAQAAAAVSDEARAPVAPRTVPGAVKRDEQRGVEVGFMLHALGNNGGRVQDAAASLERDGLGQISAAMSTAVSSAGGVLVPQETAGELIGLLRARSVVRRAGARSVPMPAGKLRHAKMTASATAGYSGENNAIPPSEPETGSLDQSFKKLTALVPVSNDLLAMSIFNAGALIRDDLVQVLALREDLAFLRGDGTSGTPKGLRNWAKVANWQAGVAATAVAVSAALRKCVSLVEDSDVPMASPGWVMRASVKNWLAELKDANGFKLYPSIDANGTLHGFPIFTTSQVPNNLGGGGNETEVTFADFNECMIGETQRITLALSSEAAYIDSGDNVVSAFQNDQTLFRAISEHDFAPAHDEAISGLNGVSWAL